MPPPDTEPFVPDPAGSPEELATSAPPLESPTVQKNDGNKTLIIVVVVLAVLLLCCCIAAVVGGLLLSNMEESDFISMAVPSLLALM
jgi:hypothetical protein